MTIPTLWRVLIIEDEYDSAEVIQEVLQAQGIPATIAQTAEEALGLMKEIDPTLLIVDLALPNMDGWGFLEKMQQTPGTAAIPAIAITAYHSIDVARKAIQAGFKGYFPKPIDSRSFVSEIARMIS